MYITIQFWYKVMWFAEIINITFGGEKVGHGIFQTVI